MGLVAGGGWRVRSVPGVWLGGSVGPEAVVLSLVIPSVPPSLLLRGPQRESNGFLIPKLRPLPRISTLSVFPEIQIRSNGCRNSRLVSILHPRELRFAH